MLIRFSPAVQKFFMPNRVVKTMPVIIEKTRVGMIIDNKHFRLQSIWGNQKEKP